MPIAGWDTLSPLLLDMKPAALNALKPVVDKYREDPEPFANTVKSRTGAGSSVERRTPGLKRSRLNKNASTNALNPNMKPR